MHAYVIAFIAFIHMYIWIEKEKGNNFHFPKVTCCLFHIATERLTFLIFSLWEWTSHSILLDLAHEHRWLLKLSKLKKLEPFCMVVGEGKGMMVSSAAPPHSVSTFSELAPCPAAPCLNAHKCNLFLRPTAFNGYSSTSDVWMSFWKPPCPVQQQSSWNAGRNPDLRAHGPALGWVRSEGAVVSRLHCFISMGIKPGLSEQQKDWSKLPISKSLWATNSLILWQNLALLLIIFKNSNSLHKMLGSDSYNTSVQPYLLLPKGN